MRFATSPGHPRKLQFLGFQGVRVEGEGFTALVDPELVKHDNGSTSREPRTLNPEPKPITLH